jgi:hypothetical protein
VPLTIPPFVAYQAPLVPIAARWHTKPPEGDKFIPCEIDWGLTVPLGQSVQFSLSAGPVEFTQIVAFSVDNGRCGGSASFLFPDTGKQLTLPPFAQGVYPVFTNALTFYVQGDGVSVGDVTVFEILNSMPPPVSVLPAQIQSHSGVSGINLAAVGTSVLIPAGVNGTLQAFTMTFYVPAAATGTATVFLQDGTGVNIWASFINGAATAQTIPVSQTGLALRFTNGLNFVVAAGSTLSAGNGVANVYYSVP